MKMSFVGPILGLSFTTLLLAVAASGGGSNSERASGQSVDYPQDYREWQHVKSMVILPGHSLHAPFGGLHHLYANEKAVEGYRTGVFPDGSVIAFDLLVALTEGNAIQGGDRKVLGVMQRDHHAFPETGGWGFEGFVAGDPKQRVSPSATDCYTCHSSVAHQDYVFSKIAE